MDSPLSPINECIVACHTELVTAQSRPAPKSRHCPCRRCGVAESARAIRVQFVEANNVIVALGCIVASRLGPSPVKAEGLKDFLQRQVWTSKQGRIFRGASKGLCDPFGNVMPGLLDSQCILMLSGWARALETCAVSSSSTGDTRHNSGYLMSADEGILQAKNIHEPWLSQLNTEKLEGTPSYLTLQINSPTYSSRCHGES